MLSAGPGKTNVFETAAGGGKIGQVLNVTKTDTFTVTGNSFQDFTDMTLAITPAATSSKILWNFCTQGSSCDQGWVRIVYGDASALTTQAIADAAGSRQRGTSGILGSSGATRQSSVTVMGLDAPNTTSATTYKLQVCGILNKTIYMNRSETYTDNSSHGNCITTLTLMEVLG